MIKDFAHICFVVGNLDKSIAFYRDALGFSHSFDFTNDQGKRFGVYLHIDGRTFFEMFEGRPEPFRDTQSYKHFCLEVDDINSTVAGLRKRGIEVSDPKMGSDNSWQAWLADPDGNRIELHHYTESSLQLPHLR